MGFNPPKLNASSAGEDLDTLFKEEREKRKSQYEVINYAKSFFYQDQQRDSFKTLLKLISAYVKGTRREQDLLLFTYSFELAETENEPNSAMNAAIKKILKITVNEKEPEKSNIFCDFEQYYHLGELAEYIDLTFGDKHFENTIWKTKKTLVDRILQKQESIRIRLQAFIRSEETAFYELAVTKQKLRNAINIYEKIFQGRIDSVRSYSSFAASVYKNYLQNKDRLRKCEIWKLIDETIDIFFPLDKTATKTNDQLMVEDKNECSQISILSSIAYLACKEIEASKYFPSRSDFYKEIMPALNKEHTNEVDDADKLKHINVLLSHLVMLQSNPKFQDKYKKRWDELKMNEYIESLKATQEQIKVQNTTPGFGTWMATQVVGAVIGVGILEGVTYASPTIAAIIPITLAGVPSIILAIAVGSAVFLVPVIVKDLIAPRAAGVAYSACQAMAKYFVTKLTMTLSKNGNNSVQISPELKKLAMEQVKIYQNFIYALLKSKNVPEKTKSRLRKVRGIDEKTHVDDIPSVRLLNSVCLQP